MIERLEAERLANAIHSLRPDWPVASLLGFLHKHQSKPLLDLAVQLAWVATLPDSKTPARIEADGPWKRAVTGGQVAPSYRYGTDVDCRVCGRHQSLIHFDHDYEPPLPPEAWATPTPEQRAAIEAARVEAGKVLPEPAPKREPRDPADVLASHTGAEQREAS